jgi:hypothetical protein
MSTAAYREEAVPHHHRGKRESPSILHAHHIKPTKTEKVPMEATIQSSFDG